MNLWTALILLLIGFVLLIKGADLFVDGASKMAIKMHVPEIVVGLTIVAMGTSAPEAAISITAAFNNNAGISIGNVIGSNIFNIALILGLTAMIRQLPVKKNTLWIEMPFVCIITLILMGLGYVSHSITKFGGLLLMILFVLFLGYLWWLSKQGEDSIEEIEELSDQDTYLKLIFITVLGVICIVYGSDVTIDAATSIAKIFGLSDRVIGLTIVSFGTSLPELVTSIMAALRGKTDLAIGNIIGSNIFNILFVLGISGLVSPMAIPFASNFLMDGFVALLVAALLFVFSMNKRSLNRLSGAIFVVIYFVYLASLL